MNSVPFISNEVATVAAVIVLFVSVDVELSVTKVELPPELGNVKVFEALSE